MKIILAYKRKETAKVKITGNALSSLTLLAAVSKGIAEQVAKEKNMSQKEAEAFVLDCVKDGFSTLKENNT